MAQNIIPQSLCDSLDYNPDTGELIWAISPNNRAPKGASAGTTRPDGYTSLCWKGKRYLLHRVAWKIHHGEEPGPLIDHIDGNPRNNAIRNLRNATRSINGMNRKAKGVYRHPTSGKWQAFIKVNQKQIRLYYGPDYSEAVKARQRAVDEYWSQHR